MHCHLFESLYLVSFVFAEIFFCLRMFLYLLRIFLFENVFVFAENIFVCRTCFWWSADRRLPSSLMPRRPPLSWSSRKWSKVKFNLVIILRNQYMISGLWQMLIIPPPPPRFNGGGILLSSSPTNFQLW